MKKFEYMEMRSEFLIEDADKKGKEGWELVSVLYSGNCLFSYLIFKREVKHGSRLKK